jgi:hypothetical protein
MNTVLPQQWIERIFARLQGIYGSQFVSKFTYIENGSDVGLINAKAVWAEELGGFLDQPEAISYALKNLPSDFAPSALEFRDLCRRAPRKELPAIEHKLTEKDHERSRDFAAKLAAVVNGGNRGADPTFWATHPKGHLAFEYIRGAAASEPARFQPCIDHLIAEGRVSPDNLRLLQRYEGNGQWVKA